MPVSRELPRRPRSGFAIALSLAWHVIVELPSLAWGKNYSFSSFFRHTGFGWLRYMVDNDVRWSLSR